MEVPQFELKGLKTQSPLVTLLNTELIKVWLKIKMQVIGSGISRWLPSCIPPLHLVIPT